MMRHLYQKEIIFIQSGIAADTMKINGAIRQFKQVSLLVIKIRIHIQCKLLLLLISLSSDLVHPSVANSVILVFCPLYSWST